MPLTKEEIQRKLNMLTPQRRQKFVEDQQAYMADTDVEIEPHPKMPLYRQFSLMHTNETALDVSFDYWLYMFIGKNDKFKIADIVTILRAADPRTYREWVNFKPYNDEQVKESLPMTEWKDFRNHITCLSNIVNPLIDAETVKILDRLLRQQSLDVTGQSKSLPLNIK